MIRLRLRAIVPVTFSKSEETNFDETFWDSEYHKLIKSMDPGDVICLIALGRNQLYFVHGYTEMKTEGKKPWRALFSMKVRIKRGPGLSDEFEPLMLANYARSVGIELVGIKLFEQYLEHLVQ